MQLSERMPGISIDEAARQVNFSLTRFYDDLATYLKNADDPDLGVFEMGLDLTERKRAEEALKQSEEKYRSLVVNLNDVIYTVNAEGYITYISPVVERLAGYQAEEIIGKT